MVVIDFSAFQVPGVKWQALLVHVYRWDPIQDEEVSTPYIVFPTEVATNDAALFKIAFESSSRKSVPPFVSTSSSFGVTVDANTSSNVTL